MERETAKRQRFAHLGEQNYGVWGKTTLPMVVAEAEQAYGHLSTDERCAIKFPRGHTVQSTF